MIDGRHLRPNLTPSKLLDLPQYFGWGLSAFDVTPSSGLVESDIIPNIFECSDVRISLTSGDTSSIISVDIHKNGSSIFEVPVTIDVSGTTSVGATTPFLFNLSATTIVFYEDAKIDFYVSGATDCLGLKVKLIGNRLIANPINQISDLILDLNADTMLTTGDVLATEGQAITKWLNAVTGNTITGATQTNGTLQPTLRISPIDGAKEVKFDGTNDFLNFNNTANPILHWAKSESHCIVVMTGDIVTDGRTFHRGYSNYAGEYSLFYFTGNYLNFVYSQETDGSDQFTIPQSLPSDKTFMATNYRGNDSTFDGWLNNTKIFNNLAVAGSHDSTSHPTLIGARTGTSPTTYGFYYGGSIRRILVWDRALTDEELTSVYNYLKA